MRSDLAVPKKNPAKEGYGGGTFFHLRESFKAFSSRTGDLLVVTDAASFPAVAFTSLMPRVSVLVLEGEDALPLFTFSDAGGLFAAGGESVMRAARVYAALNRVPCLLAPSDGVLGGIFGGKGETLLGGVRALLPLAEAETVLDFNLLAPSYASAYERLVLARLALFECRAKAMLSIGRGEFAEEMCAALSVLDGEPSLISVVEANMRLRKLESEGAPAGEGSVLAARYGGENARLRAFCELYALYAAFFKRGKPRRYAVPDYFERARRAGCTPSVPPTGEEYARRTFDLERRRADLVRETERLGRCRDTFLRTAARLSGRRYAREGDLRELKYLPERCPGGLSAFIRDFGLMDWKD